MSEVRWTLSTHTHTQWEKEATPTNSSILHVDKVQSAFNLQLGISLSVVGLDISYVNASADHTSLVSANMTSQSQLNAISFMYMLPRGPRRVSWNRRTPLSCCNPDLNPAASCPASHLPQQRGSVCTTSSWTETAALGMIHRYYCSGHTSWWGQVTIRNNN